MGNAETGKKNDLVKRGVKQSNIPGTAVFLGLRAADPFLQYGILAKGIGSGLIERLGGSVLPLPPPAHTGTFIDQLGLSPYRLILLSMATGSMLKQNFHLLTIMQEEMPPTSSAMVGAFNTVINSLNDLLFVCATTSASVNGEHFPQTPLMVGAAMYTIGLGIETVSEIQRHRFKADPANKGKVFTRGLWSIIRHPNYAGYVLWRAGYALAAGGWIWSVAMGAFNVYHFMQNSMPALSEYCQERVSRAMQPRHQYAVLIICPVRPTMGGLQDPDPVHVTSGCLLS